MKKKHSFLLLEIVPDIAFARGESQEESLDLKGLLGGPEFLNSEIIEIEIENSINPNTVNEDNENKENVVKPQVSQKRPLAQANILSKLKRNIN